MQYEELHNFTNKELSDFTNIQLKLDKFKLLHSLSQCDDIPDETIIKLSDLCKQSTIKYMEDLKANSIAIPSEIVQKCQSKKILNSKEIFFVIKIIMYLLSLLASKQTANITYNQTNNINLYNYSDINSYNYDDINHIIDDLLNDNNSEKKP